MPENRKPSVRYLKEENVPSMTCSPTPCLQPEEPFPFASAPPPTSGSFLSDIAFAHLQRRGVVFMQAHKTLSFLMGYAGLSWLRPGNQSLRSWEPVSQHTEAACLRLRRTVRIMPSHIHTVQSCLRVLCDSLLPGELLQTVFVMKSIKKP